MKTIEIDIQKVNLARLKRIIMASGDLKTKTRSCAISHRTLESLFPKQYYHNFKSANATV